MRDERRPWYDGFSDPECPYCRRLEACMCPDDAACVRCGGRGWLHGCCDGFCRGNDRDCYHAMLCPDCERDWLP